MRAARIALLPIAGLLLTATPAFSQSTPAKPAAKADQDKMICEKQEVLGSRLAVRRVCKTRAQWEDQKRVDREDLERTQQQRGMKSE